MTFASPETVADWLAFLALLATLIFGLVSLIALAWSAWRHVSTEYEKAQQAKAERLQELAKIIFNNGLAYGLGAQILAIDELRRYRNQKTAILRFVAVLRKNFTEQAAVSELFAALDDVDRAMGLEEK